jgi:hypothetical protein
MTGRGLIAFAAAVTVFLFEHQDFLPGLHLNDGRGHRGIDARKVSQWCIENWPMGCL